MANASSIFWRSSRSFSYSHVFFFFFFFLFAAAVDTAMEDGLRCLKNVKESFELGSSGSDKPLESWTFTNTSVSAICKLDGVTCWNEKEIRVITLVLSSQNLAGPLPDSFRYCRDALTNVDLSSNRISGPIPPQLCTWLPFLVTLDLSGNRLSGPIPPEIADCKFLNVLSLNNNRLSGAIPDALGWLGRLKNFSVANNQLSGMIPNGLSNFNAGDFGGNGGLCGMPLGSGCGRGSAKGIATIVGAGVSGAAGSVILGVALWLWFFVRSSNRIRGRRWCSLGRGKEGFGDRRRIRQLWSHQHEEVSLFQKPLVKVTLGHLLEATSNFDPENAVISNGAGVCYKATLRDGSVLAIKRLRDCRVSEKRFKSEMDALGQLRHPNLVPLLGYCVAGDEKLLVYKHMLNGTLSSLLHLHPHHKRGGDDDETAAGHGAQPCQLDWPTRLRISLGVARGLAWLHHGCQPPCQLEHDISSDVILLDDDMDARIAEIGIANLVGSSSSSSSSSSSYVNDGMSGSCIGAGGFGEGGMPESPNKGVVYGFGVVLLELVTGQRPFEVVAGFERNLVDWVTQLSATGRSRDVADKALVGKDHDEEIMGLIRVACTCVASSFKERPSSMYQVYESLKSMHG